MQFAQGKPLIMAQLTYKELAEKAEISEAYACQLLNGTRTKPSLELALQIYDRTGLRFGILEGLSDAAIGELPRKGESTDTQRAA